MTAYVKEQDQNTPSEQEIRQWLLSISKGDQTSFTLLLRSFWNKVYTQAITYLKSAQLAEEITQDIFIKLWSLKEKLPEVENFSDYLFIVSRNAIISTLRKKKEEITPLSDSLEELIMRPDKQLQYKEAYAKILQLIDQLPPVRKKVFKMSRLEGKSYDEIGNELSISWNGVKDHVVKALNFLRTNFNSDHLWLLILLSALLFQ